MPNFENHQKTEIQIIYFCVFFLLLFWFGWKCVILQSIETFAVTVKEIAQLLQSFGSELSDTELPDEANAIEFLLHSHTHRYRQMKVVFCSQSFPASLCSPTLYLSLSVLNHSLSLFFFASILYWSRMISGMCWKKDASCCQTWKLSKLLKEMQRRRGKYKQTWTLLRGKPSEDKWSSAWVWKTHSQFNTLF